MKLSRILWLSFTGCLLVLYVSFRLSHSNSERIEFGDSKDGDLIAIDKLNELVTNNFLKREYYEVYAYSNSYTRWVLNYNTNLNTLVISVDPGSGWAYLYYATPQELDMIAERNIHVNEMHLYLKRIAPDRMRPKFPTRSQDIFSIF